MRCIVLITGDISFGHFIAFQVVHSVFIHTTCMSYVSKLTFVVEELFMRLEFMPIRQIKIRFITISRPLFQNGLFGEGTYLSSELSVSMPYAPTGSFWKKSLIGVKASLIAVCEIIPKYSGVKCQVKGKEIVDKLEHK